MTAYAADLNEALPILIVGVKGVKSRPFAKKFRNADAMRRWFDTDAATDCDVYRVENVGR